MRFLIDMPLSPRLAQWLAEQGHDAVHATNANLAEASDSEILSRARDEQRIIVTADLDYPQLLARLDASEPSVILFRGGDWSEADAMTRLASVLAAAPGTLASTLTVIERGRVRRRRLPLGTDAE